MNLEEDDGVELCRSPGGLLGHAMPVVDRMAQLAHVLLVVVERKRLNTNTGGQLTMHDHICTHTPSHCVDEQQSPALPPPDSGEGGHTGVSTNGRGKVSVDGRGKTVVVELVVGVRSGREVDGLNQ